LFNTHFVQFAGLEVAAVPLQLLVHQLPTVSQNMHRILNIEKTDNDNALQTNNVFSVYQLTEQACVSQGMYNIVTTELNY